MTADPRCSGQPRPGAPRHSHHGGATAPGWLATASHSAAHRPVRHRMPDAGTAQEVPAQEVPAQEVPAQRGTDAALFAPAPPAPGPPVVVAASSAPVLPTGRALLLLTAAVLVLAVCITAAVTYAVHTSAADSPSVSAESI